ncbi:uncharacterized protein VNE69_10088 [Vairimorpha necatrix]|uniref:Uncharacterized protein n=1 Tax=Vairimorpha necatrix TaxID=6039 RepID=A0AAX4JFL1_9MICR
MIIDKDEWFGVTMSFAPKFDNVENFSILNVEDFGNLISALSNHKDDGYKSMFSSSKYFLCSRIHKDDFVFNTNVIIGYCIDVSKNAYYQPGQEYISDIIVPNEAKSFYYFDFKKKGKEVKSLFRFGHMVSLNVEKPSSIEFYEKEIEKKALELKLKEEEEKARLKAKGRRRKSKGVEVKGRKKKSNGVETKRKRRKSRLKKREE